MLVRLQRSTMARVTSGHNRAFQRVSTCTKVYLQGFVGEWTVGELRRRRDAGVAKSSADLRMSTCVSHDPRRAKCL